MLKSGPPRAKRRNVEKRREKSRYAARSRREKEAGIFTDLYVTVPIVSESTITHVDRIAVLRLAAVLCRVRKVTEKVFPAAVKDARVDLKDVFSEASINECLDGFLMMVDSSGLIVYISPNCSRSLGLTQTDLIGQNIHEYLHGDDSFSLLSMLDNSDETRIHAHLRMKSVLSPRGRNLTLKSAIYKTVSFVVRKKIVEFPPPQPRRPSRSPAFENVIGTSSGDISDLEDLEGKESPDSMTITELDNTYYVMHGIPMVHCGAGAMGDYHGPGTFMTRHAMDMKFSYCHDRLSDYLGYDSKALMSSSFYSLVHPEDLSPLVTAMSELYRKGQVVTGYYRLMVKSGGYVWITTTANTVTHSSRGHGGQYIVCVHQLIQDVETNDLLADVQQRSPSLLCKVDTDRKTKASKIVGPSNEQLLQRASAVTDFIPLPNPASLGVSNVSHRSDTNPKRCSQELAGTSCHQEWLFRAVGGTETSDAGQRGNEKRANSTFGANVNKRVHFDAAAGNVNVHGPETTSTKLNCTYLPADDPMFLSTGGTFCTISQADIEHLLFSSVPAASVQPADSVNIRNTTAASKILVGKPKKEDLSMLAPFVHKNDEILSLEFGQTEHDRVKQSPRTSDDFDLILTGTELVEEDVISEYGLNGSERSLGQQTDDGEQSREEVEIESIYRYLRDEQDACRSEVKKGNTEGFDPPPLLLIDPSIDSEYPNLMSYVSQPPLFGQ